MFLFFDTETTARIPREANLVQFAAIAQDSEGIVRAEACFIIRPEGWTIPEEVVKIHGIDQTMAENFGVKLAACCRLFYSLVYQSHTLVGHNIEYDMGVMERAFGLIGQKENWDRVKAKRQFCTMKFSTPHCRLPNPKYPGSYKWPTLQECYTHFFGAPFEGAHTALADVRATQRIFNRLQNEFPAREPAPA